MNVTYPHRESTSIKTHQTSSLEPCGPSDSVNTLIIVLVGSVSLTICLSANFSGANGFPPAVPSKSSNSMIRFRCIRQAIALVNATAGLTRSVWSVGDILLCVCVSRAMLIPLVSLQKNLCLASRLFTGHLPIVLSSPA